MINKDITIEELIEKYPQTIAPLREFGINCVVCGEPVWGTLEENIVAKGLADLDGIVKELNDLINNGANNGF